MISIFQLALQQRNLFSCLDGFQRLIIHNNVIWVCVQAWEKRMCYWRNMTVVWFVQNCRHKVQYFSWNQTHHYLLVLGNSVIRKMISQFPYYFFGIWWFDVIRLWCTVIKFPFQLDKDILIAKGVSPKMIIVFSLLLYLKIMDDHIMDFDVAKKNFF